MNFLSLPVEIGSKIFDYLDTKNQINVYNSCNELKDYFASWYHLKVVLTRCTLATVRSLDEKLFTDLGEHVVELNLSGVPDLTVDNLRPHIDRFVNLRSLDVTFTNIYFEHIAEICPKCLKHIGINFNYFKRRDDGNVNIIPDKITEETLEELKKVFTERQLDTIHFVILDSCALPLKFLKDVSFIKKVKLTISDHYRKHWFISTRDTYSRMVHQLEINFNSLNFIAKDCDLSFQISEQLIEVTRLNFEDIEFMFMRNYEKIEIFASPLLANIFTICCRDLIIEVKTFLSLDMMVEGNVNVVFKAWNKKTTNFNEFFYRQLFIELKDYFPTFICMHTNYIMKITDAPSSWFCVDRSVNFDKMLDSPDKLTLTEFCRRYGVAITCSNPIVIKKACKPLENLTYLSINNIAITSTFFTSLFRQCPKLTTLYLDIMGDTMYTRSLAKAIHLANLKNFMLTSPDIEYEEVFSILRRCPSLENVHICSYVENLVHQLPDDISNMLHFIENCGNLYSLFIVSCEERRNLNKIWEDLWAEAQRLQRYYLCIEVCHPDWGWNPFADVFMPSPLQIVH